MSLVTFGVQSLDSEWLFLPKITENYCKNGSSLLIKNCPVCPNGAHLIWKYPIYDFIIPAEPDSDNQFKKILMDVTTSAPRFEDPGKILGSVFEEVLESIPKKSLILDFGAGKLRNTLYFLEKGFNVCAVEFQKIEDSSDQTKKMFKKAKEFGNQFNKLLFPHEFFNFKREFDLILLINVCNIMPVPSERLLSIQYCREKLKEGGFIFWYTQHRDPQYVKKCVPEVSIGDGYYMHETDRYQTFYRDFNLYEIDEMFLANGLRFEKRYDSGSQARLYRKVSTNPLKRILDGDSIRKYVIGDTETEYPKEAGVKLLSKSEVSKVNIPNPDELKEEVLYQHALKKIPMGDGYQTEYHNLIAAIMLRLFSPILSKPKLEYDINDGRKRIDMVLNNSQENGFFKELSTRFQVKAPFVFVECKNYTHKVKNPEVDQLAMRFKDKYGNFGILTYRNYEDEAFLLQLCQDCIEQHKYIICLNDRDIISLLKRKMDEGDVDDFMEEKMSKLILV